MKLNKIYLIILSIIFIVSTASAKENFKDIYKKNIEARGGNALISSLNSYIINGELIREDSIHFHFRGAFKYPDKSIIEYYLDEDTLAIGFNGKLGWTLMPQIGMNPIELPTDKVKESVLLTITPIIEYFNELDNFKDKSKEIKIIDNKDSINNIPQFMLICPIKDNEAEIIFINKTDYQISQINTSFTVGDSTQTAIINLSDYRNIQNLNIPHHIKIYNSKTVISEIFVKSIEVNPKLEDIIFDIPK